MLWNAAAYEDLAAAPVDRFLASGYLLLETDSQHCCRWVVAASGVDDDPPAYLIDPDVTACLTRTRYANTFSDNSYAHCWDAQLWRGDLLTDFDHPLAPDALDNLAARLIALPTTYGWAMNQGCDAVYRFGGPARVARDRELPHHCGVAWTCRSRILPKASVG